MAAVNAAVGNNLLSEENSAYNERMQSLRGREFPMLQGRALFDDQPFYFLTQMT